MIIKVVELAKVDNAYTSLNDKGDISQPNKYSLCETYLNTEHVVSFREVNPKYYEDENLPDGLDERQLFTYVTLSEIRKGITVVGSPLELQKRINKPLGESEILKG